MRAVHGVALAALIASLGVTSSGCATPLQAQAAPASTATGPVAPPADLDRFVADVMKRFQVPGLALAIVRDGKVIVAKGYGVRKLGESTPVDAQTRFGIASNTKAFTATALGMLVEEGKIEWDAPVIRYLPEFAMYDPFVTREMTVRDLLVHRSGLGLGAGDLLWWPESTYDRKEIMHRLRYIRPATSFRSAYAYDNVLYLVAGEVIERVSGMPWEQFVESRILTKVGMSTSTTRHSDAMKGGNVATPHAEVEGRVRPIVPFGSDNTNPAGGINSTATDMARWMMVQLDSGRLADGSRLFTPRTTTQLWRVVTPTPIGTPAAPLAHLRPNFAGYALGMNVSDYRGRKKLQHSGGLPGYLSLLTMIPEQRLGIAVLTNQESGEAFNAITNKIVDHYAGAPNTDYLAVYGQLADAGRQRLAQMNAGARSARDSTSRPSLPLPRYAGTYNDPWYGDVTITPENGSLVMRFTKTPSLVGELVHWQHDTFVARWRDRELRADAFVSFSLNPDGTIDVVKLAPASPDVDFSFDFQDLLLRPKPAR
jgi:CubicO group peptidase (beta-lactamase class C family)